MFKLFSKNGLAKLNELHFPEERFIWKSPWFNLEDNPDLRLGIQKELNSEIGPKHPLWGLKPVVFGKCDANDDIVVHLCNNKYACVHLVWHGKIDQYPDKYPSVVLFDNASELQNYINEEADNYT